MVGLEGKLRPAVDRGPRPLAEEAAPAGDRLRLRGGKGGMKRAVTPPLIAVSAPPRSTETSRLTPFSIIVTP